MPGGDRLVGAALGRNANMLERALDSGVFLPPDLVDEAVVQAFSGYGFALPISEPWRRLETIAASKAQPNLMVLSFVGALGRGTHGREQMIPLFSPLNTLAVHRLLSADARKVLERALQAAGIHRLSISDALYQALINTFSEGEVVEPEILCAVGRGEIDGLAYAIYSRMGLSCLKGLVLRARGLDERVEGWKTRRLDDFIRRKEKAWFW